MLLSLSFIHAHTHIISYIRKIYKISGNLKNNIADVRERTEDGGMNKCHHHEREFRDEKLETLSS